MFNAFQKNHIIAGNLTYLFIHASNSYNQIKARQPPFNYSDSFVWHVQRKSRMMSTMWNIIKTDIKNNS